MDTVIRHYLKKDRQDVRSIAWDTAFSGQEAGAFFDNENKELLQDFLTIYFTDYESESCFVAESKGRVVGYLLGAKNTSVMDKVFRSRIIFPLLAKLFVSSALFRIKNLKFFLGAIISLLRGEFQMPDFRREYPATLHINLTAGFRGQGIGSRLISAYLDYLKIGRIRGIYLATMSERARHFFIHEGFILLHQGRRSYFRHILKRDIPIYIFGKKLSL